MTIEVNAVGSAHAHSLIGAGSYDDTSSWSFSAEDGDKLLGAGGDDWTAFAAMHLAVDTEATPETKARWKYPFGKDGKVYGAALRAIRSRASHEDATGVFDDAGTLLDAIKAKEGDSKSAGAAARVLKARCDAGGLQRAYSVLTVRAMSDDERVITGVATTPSTDRMGDIVEPLGVKFKNPMPLLWQHMSDKPVGTVTFDKPTKAGITFKASVASLDIPGTLKDRLDEAWQSVRLGLVKAVSIGFRPIEYSWMEDGGIHFLESEVMELSLVTIPAQADATIATIKSFDATALAEARARYRPIVRIGAAAEADSSDIVTEKSTAAATGQSHRTNATIPPAGVSATIQTPVVKAQEGKTMPSTIADQIASFTETLKVKSVRMDEIMATAAEKGETLGADQIEEYETCKAEKKSITEHLDRLRDHEKTMVSRAVDLTVVKDPETASAVRARTPATVRSSPVTPKGIGFVRFCMAVARSKGNLIQAERMVQANDQWMAETPDVLTVVRSAINAGTTTDPNWAGPLVQYQNLASEFIEYLRPLTIIGRLPGLRYVPFKVKIPRQTGRSTAQWVGEGQAKPVSALAFDSVTMDIATISDIVIFSQQLAQLSQPSVEMLIRDDLASTIVNFMDAQFIDPTVSSTGVSPASVTNGVSPVVSSGTTADNLRIDIGQLIEGFLEANMQLNSPVWVMSQVTAAKINLVRNALGQKEYPEINVNGGLLEGFPVVTSQSVPSTGGSPTDGYPIVLMNAGDILIADDGQVRIDASSEASLQMDSAPDSPTLGTTTLVSLWQQGYMGLKADRDINWVKRRSTAVAYISNAKYTTG